MPHAAIPMARRTFLAGLPPLCAATATAAPALQADMEALDRKVADAMRRYAIPGVALGLIRDGQAHRRCYGRADIGQPRPVDANTVFRIASTSKTFTGTAAMRLVDAGRLALDAPVQRYLPDFQPPPGAGTVTVRQLLDHSAGWLGYDYHDTGDDDGALARYVHDIRRLPQLTPAGRVFSYNNAAISAGGRIVEVLSGASYETAIRQLLLDPLGLRRSGFTLREVGSDNVAVPHSVANGKPVAAPELFRLPRSCNPFGGVLSCLDDQLAWARFHLGDGHAAGPGGARLLREASLRAMRTHPGPGGTLLVELDGMAVTWMLRPTAEGPTVVQHGGDLPGFHSGFLMVPERGFALTVLTNSEGGRGLVAELFADDWALDRFAGLHNLPATPRRLSARELAAYEGRYIGRQIGFDGAPIDTSLDLAAADGALRLVQGEPPDTTDLPLTFYRDDGVLAGDGGLRADFLRDPGGRVAWLRLGGRLFHRAT